MSSLEELIEEVHRHDCLWNKNLEAYRNKNVRDNAWESISKEMEKPVENLKHEWKKLQDCYRQAMMRRRTISGPFAKKIKPWKYEELMSFLTADSLPKCTQFNNDTYDEGAENLDSEEQIAKEIKQEEYWPDDDQSNHESDSQSYTKRFKDNKRNIKEEDPVDEVIKFLSETESTKKLSGELDYFFASACESTKGLPRLLQIRVKQEIMNSITNAEIEYLNSRPQSSSSWTLPYVSTPSSTVIQKSHQDAIV